MTTSLLEYILAGLVCLGAFGWMLKQQYTIGKIKKSNDMLFTNQIELGSSIKLYVPKRECELLHQQNEIAVQALTKKVDEQYGQIIIQIGDLRKEIINIIKDK